MEKILKIEETSFEHKNTRGWNMTYEGFIITTDKQIIRFGIESGQQCCEDYGYLLSQDNINDFIGSSLISIEQVDESLSVKQLQKACGQEGCEEFNAIFININTSNGLLQFTSYNEHNGYYGHSVLVESEKFKINFDL